MTALSPSLSVRELALGRANDSADSAAALVSGHDRKSRLRSRAAGSPRCTSKKSTTWDSSTISRVPFPKYHFQRDQASCEASTYVASCQGPQGRQVAARRPIGPQVGIYGGQLAFPMPAVPQLAGVVIITQTIMTTHIYIYIYIYITIMARARASPAGPLPSPSSDFVERRQDCRRISS